MEPLFCSTFRLDPSEWNGSKAALFSIPSGQFSVIERLPNPIVVSVSIKNKNAVP